MASNIITFSFRLGGHHRRILPSLMFGQRAFLTISTKSKMVIQIKPPPAMIIKREMKLWNEKLLRNMYWRKRRFDVEPEKLRHRSEWQDWDYQAELFAFANRIGEPQLDQDILQQAFIHRSYVLQQQANQEKLGLQDIQMDLRDNQEMIQNGSELMSRFLPRYLRYFLRHAPEECIQALVKYLTSRPVLSDISKWIGCIDMVLCPELPPTEETLAETIPALTGAIIQSTNGDTKRAQNFLIDFVLTYLNGQDLLEIWRIDQLDLNLNHFLQARYQKSSIPEPRVLHQSAIGTIEACYVVGIYLEKKLLGQSPGETLEIAKKMAELDVFRNEFRLRTDQVRLEFGTQSYELNFDQFDRENFRLFPDDDRHQVKVTSGSS